MSGRRNVMIVDDTPANLRLMVEIVAELGVEPRPAFNGEMALMAAQLQPPDLVLLDVRMPGMDGIEVCRRLKQITTLIDVPVIFITAEATDETRSEAAAVGGHTLLSKPINAEQICTLVLEVLQLRSQ